MGYTTKSVGIGRYSLVNSHNYGKSSCLIGNLSNSMAMASIAICVIGDLSLADWRKTARAHAAHGI